MPIEDSKFERLSGLDRLLNGVVRALVRLGVGPAHMQVLEVRGRKTGKVYSLPVDLLAREGSLYLVAPRGSTQWSRNVDAVGELTLRRGRQRRRYRIRSLSESEKPPILKAYLDAFRNEVQRFFPVAAGSPLEAFTPLAPRYPAFQLLPQAE